MASVWLLGWVSVGLGLRLAGVLAAGASSREFF